MKKRVALAAKNIALIQEMFSKKEIQEAIGILDKKWNNSELQNYLRAEIASNVFKKTNQKLKTNSASKSHVPVSLKDSNPEKFRVLQNIENLMVRGEILTTLEEVRKLGEHYSKEFSADKSRRKSIAKLIAVLSELHNDDLISLLHALTEEKHSEGSAYQRLAEYIITGESNSHAKL